MMPQISESSNPLAGISVPGTPLVIVRKMAESVDPWIQRPEVRSGPRPPPPRALKPWHGEQLARNREAPSLIAAALASAELEVEFPVAVARVAWISKPA